MRVQSNKQGGLASSINMPDTSHTLGAVVPFEAPVSKQPLRSGSLPSTFTELSHRCVTKGIYCRLIPAADAHVSPIARPVEKKTHVYSTSIHMQTLLRLTNSSCRSRTSSSIKGDSGWLGGCLSRRARSDECGVPGYGTDFNNFSRMWMEWMEKLRRRAIKTDNTPFSATLSKDSSTWAGTGQPEDRRSTKNG